ncbi:ABC transporter substrate-binding protein [Elioraea rosea]|uniref:ABC transporter substrate-binding protein n=1 Tax=Elioraea rosea TaxID=2492390 RepID=UPI00131521A8|nr:ABC transporter substrate-binding protein [Elioraea rosea]
MTRTSGFAGIPMPFINRRGVLLGAAATATLLGARRGFAQGARDTIVMGLVNYPPNIKPLENTGSSSGAVKLAIFRGLLSYNADGVLQPELAERWTPDGTTAHVFKLRDNARFHNGAPVMAEDVAFTIGLIQDPKYTAFLRADFQIVERVEIVDPKMVRIVLKAPSAPFPHLLASYHAPILSKAAGEPDAAKPIGAGPYMLKSMERGVAVEVERFADYYRPGKPKTPRIRFVNYPDENLRVAALESGDIDVTETLPWQAMDGVERNPRLKMDSTVGPFMYLTFNTRSGPFTNVKLRQAVAFACKRDDVVKAAHFGRGRPLNGLPYPGKPFSETPANDQYRHDPDMARKLLREAGFPNGFQCRLLSTTSPTLHQTTAEVVQQNLAEVGIQVELALTEWATRTTMGNQGRYEFSVAGTVGAYNDPDSVTTFIGSGPSAYARSFGFSSTRIDELLTRGRTELDEAKRMAIYDELQKAAFEEMPIVGLTWRSQAYGMQRGLEGFRNFPGALTFHSPISLEDTVKT